MSASGHSRSARGCRVLTATAQENVQTESAHAGHPDHGLALLALGALGVVYGDIGTSPLYAMRECFHGPHQIAVTPLNVLGVLSLIVWSLIIVVTVKYLVFILRADNRGEGGILALTALVTPVKATTRKRRKAVITLGLFGASLLYADGMITPSISVLSAVEGINVATPRLERFVLPLTIVILIVLFAVQSRGTARIGRIFGPVIFTWFITMAALGILHIVQHPDVLRAISPHYAMEFFPENGWRGFIILGSVFLVVTGGEALYADIGHFGVRPIRVSWMFLVLPALLLNYFGQGAFLIANAANPAAHANPFYRMAPDWALYPLVGLAAMAAVIASQALITGAFSLTLQAVQLGYAPRVTIRHTSARQFGQIYIPAVNWGLMIACVLLVIGFKNSSNLAAAYGVAITITMLITTLLFFVFVREKWNWGLLRAGAVCGTFFIIEGAFFAANVTKIPDGGWFPLVVAAVAFTVMSTWREGRRILGQRMRERFLSLELFLAQLLLDKLTRVPGIAVFMSGNPLGTPPALRHNVTHNHILHETVVILSIETAEIPHVPPAEQIAVEQIGEGFWRIMLNYGFMDEPDVPQALSRVREPGLDLAGSDVSYFLGRETILASEHPGMSLWRERLFTWLSRNSQPATHYFNLPPERVVEVGVQVEI